MKKRYLAAMAIIAITLSACGNAQGNSQSTQEVAPQTQTAEAVVPQTTAEPETAVQNKAEQSAVPQTGSQAAVAVAPKDTVAQTQTTQQNTTKNAAAPAASTAGITEAQAKEIALTHAQVAEADATFLTVKLGYDDGVSEYEIEFYVQNKEYDYEINAADGTILSFDYDIENYAPSKAAAGQTAGTASTQAQAAVTIEDAKKSALSRVSGASDKDISIKQDHDDGRLVYEGKIIYNNIEYDFEIDAANGNFTDWEEESVFD